ncbi:aromatase/cyclase [Streptomyces sp. NBC_01190]|uniref:aromatase/cyclase n=1 Tax=Streptomyces sp. NBC_01190 TaxID=2903767 RepID=UPI003867CB12|nr:aromatase/cyclase [Streptomyces sp. NBC_01190]
MSVPMTDKPEAARQVVVHRSSVAAPADLCFDLVAQVERAPQFFGSHLHAEVTVDGGQETVQRWVLAPGDGIRAWTARRTVDAAARTITFEHIGDTPPVCALRGEWSFTETGPGTTEVRLEHALTFTGGDDAGEGERQAALDRVDLGGQAQLAQLREVAESHARLTARTVRARASVQLTATDAGSAFERALHAVEHDGAGWAWAPAVGRAIVLKRVTALSGRLHAATARIDVAGTRDGAEVTVSAAVTAAEDGPAPAALGRWLPGAVARVLVAVGQPARTA